jgi:hypothetical protein
VKALLRVDDKKELSDPPRVQEKELKEPERISLSNIPGPGGCDGSRKLFSLIGLRGLRRGPRK